MSPGTHFAVVLHTDSELQGENNASLAFMAHNDVIVPTMPLKSSICQFESHGQATESVVSFTLDYCDISLSSTV